MNTQSPLTYLVNRRQQFSDRVDAEYTRLLEAHPEYPPAAARQEAEAWAFCRDVECRDDIIVRVDAEPDLDGPDDFEPGVTRVIRRRLRDGDVWACAAVTVSITAPDGRVAKDHLCGCNYEDERDFRRGGYYADMLVKCLDELDIDVPRTEREWSDLVMEVARASRAR